MAQPDVKLESHRRDDMLHHRWTIVLAALLLAACGGATQPAQQARGADDRRRGDQRPGRDCGASRRLQPSGHPDDRGSRDGHAKPSR